MFFTLLALLSFCNIIFTQTCFNYNEFTLDFGGPIDRGQVPQFSPGVLQEFTGNGPTQEFMYPGRGGINFTFGPTVSPATNVRVYYTHPCNTAASAAEDSIFDTVTGTTALFLDPRFDTYQDGKCSAIDSQNDFPDSMLSTFFPFMVAHTGNINTDRWLDIDLSTACPGGVLGAQWSSYLIGDASDQRVFFNGMLSDDSTLNRNGNLSHIWEAVLPNNMPVATGQNGYIEQTQVTESFGAPGFEGVFPFYFTSGTFVMGSSPILPEDGTPYDVNGPYPTRLRLSWPVDTVGAGEQRMATLQRMTIQCCTDATAVNLDGCGDNVVANPEECDINDVACTNCQINPGFICESQASPIEPFNETTRCFSTCGDELLALDEDCEPVLGGNEVVGCTETCTPAAGFSCSRIGPGAVSCEAECGDGVVATGVEGCDDGNTNDGDGCNSNCEEEVLIDTQTIVIVVVVVVGSCLMCCIVGGFAAFCIAKSKGEVEKVKTDFEQKLSASSIFHNSEFRASRGSALNTINHLTNVEIGEIIGKGNFGNVYRGMWNGNPVALKSLKSDDVLEMENELTLLRNLENPQVLRCWGIYWESQGTESETVYIVTEFMSKGDLLSLLQSDGTLATPTIRVSDLISMSHQCALGMDFLHENKVIHRDLACRNLLVETKNDAYAVKISDFGLSRFTDDYYKSDSKTIPVRWTAPEAIKFHRFTKASDVWSYGIVLWEIFSRGAVPYPGLSNKKVIDKVSEGYRLESPKECPEEFGDLVQQCWEADPADRPNFAQIKKQFETYKKENPDKVQASFSSSSIFSSENRYHNTSTPQVEHAYSHEVKSSSAKIEYNTDDESERYNTRVSLIMDPDDLPQPKLDGPEDFYNNSSLGDSQARIPIEKPDSSDEEQDMIYNN